MTATTAPIMIDSSKSEGSLTARALRVPLLAKLAGANALIVLVAWMATWLSHRANGGDVRVLLVLALSLAAGLVVNVALVAIALRPIRLIEDTAERFWKGDLAARVPWSAVADRDIERLSEALNLLLETNEQERVRLRALAEGVMQYEERVRVETARVLQESHAQSLAGLMYRISAAINDCGNEDCRVELEEAREIAKRGVEELRELSSRVHPRLLDDFGLIAAVRQMCRSVQKGATGTRIDVDHEEVFSMQGVSTADKAVLYRVTEEAVLTALTRCASRVVVSIRASEDGVEIDVRDNGNGVAFQNDANLNARLWLMRERLAFIGGSLVAHNESSSGTTVSMQLPLNRTIMEQHLHRVTSVRPDTHAA